MLRLLLFLSFSTFAQSYYTLSGTVTTEDASPLESAIIRVFNLNTGTTTKPDGTYKIRLIEGLNRVSITHLGFSNYTFEIVIFGDSTKNIKMALDQKKLDEITIRSKRRDPAYEVIRNVIENKAKWQNQYANYRSEVYIRALESSENPKKKTPKADSLKKLDPSDTLNKYAFFECQLIKHKTAGAEIKEERLAVKKHGNLSTVFYQSVSDGEFDLYKNHQQIPKIGPAELTSPFSDLALLAYKYELIKLFYDGPTKIYHIRVTPRDAGNALYTGEIEIVDDLWVCRYAKLSISPRALLLHDSFSFEYHYTPVEQKYMLTEASYRWSVKEGKTKRYGSTTLTQSKFAFDLALPKRFFGSEIGRTDQLAYTRDTTYWQAARQKPLSLKESSVLNGLDSLKAFKNSKKYLDSIDLIANRITFGKVLYSGITHINRSKKIEWEFGSLLGFIDPVVIGGWRIRYGIGVQKRFENRKRININTNTTYGFLNKDLKGQYNVWYLYNPLKRANIYLSTGSGFGAINSFASLADIAKRTNFYQNRYFLASHRVEVVNGLYFNSSAFHEKRFDLSDFKFQKLGDTLFKNNRPTLFPDAFVNKLVLGLDYTPRQLYLREPNEKVILGSAFPTFSIDLNQALSFNNTKNAKFSSVEFGIKQTFNINVFGTSNYSIKSGRFIDTTRLSPMDYRYIRGSDQRWFSPPSITFQQIPATFKALSWVHEAHYVHHFNGYLTSKIPLINKTKLNEMLGGGLLYVPGTNYKYAEVFGGLTHIIKLGRERHRIGIYYTSGWGSAFQGSRTGFKISYEPYNAARNTWSF